MLQENYIPIAHSCIGVIGITHKLGTTDSHKLGQAFKETLSTGQALLMDNLAKTLQRKIDILQNKHYKQ